MHKNDYSDVFSRVMPVEGDAHKKCVNFLNYIARKADIYTEYNCEEFLRYVLLCIRPEYRKRGKSVSSPANPGFIPNPAYRIRSPVLPKRRGRCTLALYPSRDGDFLQLVATKTRKENRDESKSLLDLRSRQPAIHACVAGVLRTILHSMEGQVQRVGVPGAGTRELHVCGDGRLPAAAPGERTTPGTNRRKTRETYKTRKEKRKGEEGEEGTSKAAERKTEFIVRLLFRLRYVWGDYAKIRRVF